MPELPEVEAMRRDIARRVQGDTLSAVAFRAEGWGTTTSPQEVAPASGDLFLRAVHRRSRLLLLDFGDRILLLEPRMTGRPRWEPPASGQRLALHFGSGQHLYWEDVRGLGSATWWQRRALVDHLAEKPWGPDAWPAPRSGAWWAARFRGARGACKPAWMATERVAGLGNIAASELCWRLGWSPWMPIDTLDADAWSSLARAVPQYVEEVLADFGEHDMRFVRERESPPETFAVYARAGLSCPRCSGTIRRAAQSGRSTFWCPECQAGVR